MSRKTPSWRISSAKATFSTALCWRITGFASSEEPLNAWTRASSPITFKGLNYDIIVEFCGFKWLIQTTDYHGVGTTIGIRLNPEDIHIMKKSEYSGMFGDYSSYSAEYDELTEDAEDEEE